MVFGFASAMLVLEANKFTNEQLESLDSAERA
jgi:hypothetical protein